MALDARLAPVSDAAGAQARAAAAEQELQSFSYMVSHDLAAAFRQVSGFSGLLLGGLGDSLTDAQRAYADHIRAGADRCQLMMEQLLVYSPLLQMPLERARRNAGSILQTPLLQLAGQATATGAEIAVEPLGEVFADADLLATAFACLLENAIRFRRPDVPPRITVRPAHDSAFWRMRVADNGLGVEPAYRERVFQMFKRLHGENQYPGVGAGLAIVRRIARLHGGEAAFLDCEQGACVELALPWEGAAR